MTDDPSRKDGVRRTRVLYLIKALGPGGAEQLLLTHLKFIDRSKYDVHVAHVFNLDGQFYEDVIGACDRIVRLSRRNNPGSFGVLRLARLLLTERFDIVHIHSPLLGSMARLILRLRRRAARPVVVTTEHLVWRGYHRATRLINRLSIRFDDWVFAVSPEVRQSMVVKHPERVEVLAHGVDLSVFRPDPGRGLGERDRLGIDHDSFVIGTIANYRPQKNHELVLAIAAELERDRTSFTWVLAGSGPLESTIRSRIEQLGLGDCVRLLGIADDSAALLNAIDVFVLTSLWEGLPVVLMEALASGLPIVASDVEGIHDAVHGSESAVLLDLGPSAVGDFRDVLSDLRRNPGRRASMGRAALDLSRRFDAVRVTALMCARYVALLGAGPTLPPPGAQDSHR